VPMRTPRETTQPNRACTAYWASGLTHVYLDGALRRAVDERPQRLTARDEVRLDLTVDDRRLLKLLGIAAGAAGAWVP